MGTTRLARSGALRSFATQYLRSLLQPMPRARCGAMQYLYVFILNTIGLDFCGSNRTS